jgi:hypothetical protein
MQSVLYILLGWLSGLFSTVLLEWNRDNRHVKSLRAALRFEVVSYRHRMAGVAFMLFTRSNQLLLGDRLNWLIGEFDAYHGPDRNEAFLETLCLLRDHPTESRVVAARFAEEASQASPGLKKYPTPALDAAVAAVALFKPDEQTEILELRTLVSNFEAAVDEAWRFFEMTFNASLNDESRRRVNVNAEMAYSQIAQLCERIANQAARVARAV